MIGLRPRGAFADARFRRLLIGQSLSTFGDTVLYLTLGIWAKALTTATLPRALSSSRSACLRCSPRRVVISPTGSAGGLC